MGMLLRNMRILITAGPTWVPVDQVRVLSNTASGETGMLLAQKLHSRGAKVTLILGPTEAGGAGRGIRILRFKFFDQLRGALARELRLKKYDIILHSAAVSDYQPQTRHKRKVSSGKVKWLLTLVPAPKLIDLIKKLQAQAYLVGFKFLPRTGRKKLVKAGHSLIKRAGADLVVANTIHKKCYRAYLVDDFKVSGAIFSKKALVNELCARLKEEMRCRN